MTEQEVCDKQRENGNQQFYLLLRGTFWRAYDGGAFALARVTDYQIRYLRTVNRYVLGFNKPALASVLEKMHKQGLEVVSQDEWQIVFSGGDPTVDERLVKQQEADEPQVDMKGDYRVLCVLRRELMDINLADEGLTLSTLKGTIRNLQMRCLSHLIV